MGKNIMTKEQAIRQIIADGAAELSKALNALYDSSVAYYDIFGQARLIHRLVSARWSIMYPEDFVCCYCTDEADYKASHSNHSYNWYMAMMNSKFDPTDSYKISDRTADNWIDDWLDDMLQDQPVTKEEAEEAWRNEFRNRLDNIIAEILACPDIRIYVMQHFQI